MVTIMNILAKWLQEIEAEEPVIKSEAPLVEARENHWKLFLNGGNEAKSLKNEDIIRFLNDVVQVREKQITEPMTFYCWFDEQASALCLGLVSASEQELPFGATYRLESELTGIVENFRESNYHNGIPWRELEDVTVDDKEFLEENSCGDNYKLNVWAKRLVPVNDV